MYALPPCNKYHCLCPHALQLHVCQRVTPARASVSHRPKPPTSVPPPPRFSRARPRTQSQRRACGADPRIICWSPASSPPPSTSFHYARRASALHTLAHALRPTLRHDGESLPWDGSATPALGTTPPRTRENDRGQWGRTRACSRFDWGCRWLAAASATESRPRGKAPPSPSPSHRGQMAACDARTSPAPPRPLRAQRGIGRLGGSGGLSRASISSRSRAHKLISHRGGHLDGHLGVHIGGPDPSGPRARWSAEMLIR